MGWFQQITGGDADAFFQSYGMRTTALRHSSGVELAPRPLLFYEGYQGTSDIGFELEDSEQLPRWKATIPRQTLIDGFGDWATAAAALQGNQLWEINDSGDGWVNYRTYGSPQISAEGDRWEITLVGLGFEDVVS